MPPSSQPRKHIPFFRTNVQEDIIFDLDETQDLEAPLRPHAQHPSREDEDEDHDRQQLQDDDDDDDDSPLSPLVSELEPRPSITTAASMLIQGADSTSLWPIMRRSSLSVRKLSGVAGVDASPPTPRFAPHQQTHVPQPERGRCRPSPFSSDQARSSSCYESLPISSAAADEWTGFEATQEGEGAASVGFEHPSFSEGLHFGAPLGPVDFPHSQETPPPPKPVAALHHRPNLMQSLIVGGINAVVGLPIMLSFAAIVFRGDPAFGRFLSSLIKLVFLSSAVHQMVFSLGSSMPFAVGQVQDVGLIFLSAMATDVAELSRGAGLGDRDVLGTVLVCLTLATVLCGVAITVTGAFKLATLVQYCPLPVVGGYLGYVGLFCLASGLSLASGQPLTGISTWVNLLRGPVVLRLAPAIVMAATLSMVQKRVRTPLALPLLLLVAPLFFYAVLFVGGWTLEDARAGGWVTEPQQGAGPHWRPWHVWKLYNITSFPPQNIYWAALPRQIGKLFGLYVAVAFGSSMDVAAIQTEAPKDLEFNRELVTVGVSNIVAGCFGVGLTGSYIFSQTLLSLRMGVTSAWMGSVVVLAEVAAASTPIDILAYIPRFYFGGLVAFIGYDILKDWLIIAAKRVAIAEYALLLFTFLSVATLGLELGIALGVVASALHFSVAYSATNLKAFSVVPSRSGAVRPFQQRVVLEAFSARVAAVALSGYLFFGSATKIADQVMHVARSLLLVQPHSPSPTNVQEHHDRIAQSAAKPPPSRPTFDQGTAHGQRLDEEAAVDATRLAPGTTRITSSAAHAHQRERQDESQRVVQQKQEDDGAQRRLRRVLPSEATLSRLTSTYDGVDALLRQGTAAQDLYAVGAALKEAPLVLLLDVSRVQGIDATAARALITLQTRLWRQGVSMALTGLKDDATGTRIRRLLVGQGIILKDSSVDESQHAAASHGAFDEGDSLEPHLRWFPTMDAGLHHFEECFLRVAVRHGVCPPAARTVSLQETLKLNLEVPPLVLGPEAPDYGTAAAALERHCTKVSLRVLQPLFSPGDDSDCIFIIESAEVICRIDAATSTVHSRAAATADLPSHLSVQSTVRELRYGPGALVGDLDFVLQRPRSFAAVCTREGDVWKLGRAGFAALASDAPQVLIMMQAMMLRVNCLSASHALEVHERSRM